MTYDGAEYRGALKEFTLGEKAESQNTMDFSLKLTVHRTDRGGR